MNTAPPQAPSPPSALSAAPTTAPPQLAAWVLRLRAGVAFLQRASREAGGPPEFVIEDSTRDKFFRIGERERAILARVDGIASLEAIIAEARQNDPGLELTDDQVLEIGRWLLSTGLGHLTAHPTHGEVERAEALRLRGRLGWLNPISMKFKLGNPDGFLHAMLPVCEWLLGPLGAILGLLIALAGGLVLITQWERFSGDMRGILGPDRWWLLLVVWLGLKGIHEFAHGLTCKRYGGHVREWGVLFILFAPLGAWVNVTSSWKFPSRWQRIHVAAAGMLCEVVLAGAAAIAWSHCEPGMLRYALQNVVISASVITILFNMNPLMRFDGYFILSELVGIPNLAGRGQQAVTRQWQRVLLGVKRPTPAGSLWRRALIAGYGWTALYWRVMIGIGILIACMTLLHGFGLVLAISCAGFGYLWPLVRTAQFVVAGDRQIRPHPLRAATGFLVAGGLVAALFTVIPWPGNVVAHGVVDYSQRTPIRAAASGFVQTVDVGAGDYVQVGQPLFVLKNEELQSEATINASKLAEARDRSRYFLAESAMAAWHSEEERILSLTARSEDTAHRLAGLHIEATDHGQVLGRDLEHLSGQWIERGTLLCEIGREEVKEILFAVPQQQLQSLSSNVSAAHEGSARVIPVGDGGRDMAIHLQGFLPTAEWQPPHPALSGHLGGPLAVQPISDHTSQAPRWQLLRPHIAGRVSLTPEQSRSLKGGERVTILLTEYREPFARHLCRVTSDWLHEKVETAWKVAAMQ